MDPSTNRRLIKLIEGVFIGPRCVAKRRAREAPTEFVQTPLPRYNHNRKRRTKMDIFNKVPTIAEDTVVFSIYSQPGEDETSVLVLSALILAFVNDELVPNHLWHRDSFDIKVVENEDDKSVHQWIMEGTVRVGDCIDDEWCIVWLLMEISAKWDVVIRYGV